MTQYKPTADTDHHGALPSNNPVFGLGIATGILGILSSPAIFSLAAFISFFALDEYPLIGILAVAYWALAIAALVLGIPTIVRNRQWSSTLPLSLLGIAVFVVLFSLAATFTEMVGGALWVLSLTLLPLIIVALLAYFSARKQPEQNPS